MARDDGERGTMLRRIASATLLALGTLAVAGPAHADRSACARIEAQLAGLSKGGGKSALFEKYDAAVHRQQYELDRALKSARRYGCNGGRYLFGSPSGSTCDSILDQIDDMRANLDKLEAKREKLSRQGSGNSGAERARLTRALARNGCGRERTEEARRDPDPAESAGTFKAAVGPTYRTLCVRTCDGYYWPMSFSTTAGRFETDEQACAARCPTAETKLYIHRNPGETAENMVSLEGKPYAELATAFRYREKFDAACSCGTAPGGMLEALNESAEDRPTADAAAAPSGPTEATTKIDKPEFLDEGAMRSSMAIPGMSGEATDKPGKTAKVDKAGKTGKAGKVDKTDDGKAVAGDDAPAAAKDDAQGDVAAAGADAAKDEAPDTVATADEAKPAEADAAATDETGTKTEPKRKVRIVGPSYSYIR